MNNKLFEVVAVAAGLGSVAMAPAEVAAQSGPAVKMSKKGICHPRDGSYYNHTKAYTPYPIMEECIRDGGRWPKPAVPTSVANKAANATPVVQVGENFTCTPVAIWDGDGPIWCAEGPRVRLSGIAAREMDETCSAGHPCPDATGIAARDELVGLLGGPKGSLPTGHIKVSAPPLTCISKGSGKGSRTAAFCQRQDGVDLSCAMVRSGKAVRWQRYWGSHTCP